MAAVLVMVFGIHRAGAEGLGCVRPGAPDLPDGAVASFQDMEAGSHRLQEYLQAMDAYVECLAKEADRTRLEQNQTVDRWNLSVEAFNKRTPQ